MKDLDFLLQNFLDEIDIAEKCNVSVGTVSEWKRNKARPRGLNKKAFDELVNEMKWRNRRLSLTEWGDFMEDI